MWLFNPNAEAAPATVDLAEAILNFWRPTTAQRVDFEGPCSRAAQALTRPGLDLTLAAKQIVTVRFLTAAPA